MKKIALLISTAVLLGAAYAILLPLLRVTSAQGSAAEVKIDNFSFTPASITVAAGTQVRWTNRDDIPHTVVSDDKLFRSKALDTDDVFEHTFNNPGTYKYFCSLHPKMTATVVVK